MKKTGCAEEAWQDPRCMDSLANRSDFALGFSVMSRSGILPLPLKTAGSRFYAERRKHDRSIHRREKPWSVGDTRV